MTKTETIERLCKLASKVGDEVFANQEASDCFCHKAPESDPTFVMGERVIRFIEIAVENSIRTKKELDTTPNY